MPRYLTFNECNGCAEIHETLQGALEAAKAECENDDSEVLVAMVVKSAKPVRRAEIEDEP